MGGPPKGVPPKDDDGGVSSKEGSCQSYVSSFPVILGSDPLGFLDVGSSRTRVSVITRRVD